jgi:hypothetical protein
MFGAVAVLVVALVVMALTDSPIPGWIAVGSLVLWGIGRLLLMGVGALGGDDDGDFDLDV